MVTSSGSSTCLTCHSVHTGTGACPTCGGALAPSELATAIIRRAASTSRAATRRRVERSLRAWERLRVRKLELALLIAAVAAAIVAPLAVELQAYAFACAVALLGCVLVVRTARLSGDEYRRLPRSRDAYGHLCILCGNRGFEEVAGLFGTSVRCLWCRTHLYHSRRAAPIPDDEPTDVTSRIPGLATRCLSDEHPGNAQQTPVLQGRDAGVVHRNGG